MRYSISLQLYIINYDRKKFFSAGPGKKEGLSTLVKIGIKTKNVKDKIFLNKLVS